MQLAGPLSDQPHCPAATRSQQQHQGGKQQTHHDTADEQRHRVAVIRHFTAGRGTERLDRPAVVQRDRGGFSEVRKPYLTLKRYLKHLLLLSTRQFQTPDFCLHAYDLLSAKLMETKSFITALSDSLWFEQKARGVYVMGLCPGITDTQFQVTAGGNKADLPKGLTQTPGHVVEVAMVGTCNMVSSIQKISDHDVSMDHREVLPPSPIEIL